MQCAKCENDLLHCTCPDLLERVESLAKTPFLVISKEKLELYRKQGRKNKREGGSQTRQE